MAGEWLAATANTNMFTYEIAPVFSLMESEVGGWCDFWLMSNNLRNVCPETHPTVKNLAIRAEN